MSQTSERHREQAARSKILQESDLIFSAFSIPVSKTLSDISKRTLNISNRLRSIDVDACFIADVALHLTGIPIVANERCGSWYVRPELKAGSAYFKSTDGHWGQWGFSLRRLNLGVLGILGGSDGGGGCVIVDSTRRGKHLPDALSKTVPIWCAVMNRLLFPHRVESHRLRRLPEVTSVSEAWQIESRLAGFVHEAGKLDLDLETLRMKVTKPLRPFWIARSLGLLPHTVNEPRDDSVLPIYLCMASEHHDFRFTDADGSYVQGAGDDGEHWANGLSAELYWQHQASLLRASEDQVRETIARVVAEDQCKQKGANFNTVEKAPWLQIGVYDDDIRSTGPGDVIVVCTPLMRCKSPGPRFLHLKCEEGKLGSRKLREELEKIPMFLSARLAENGTARICCTTGKDVSIGVGLAVLCLFGDDQGRLRLSRTTNLIDKAIIKKKLSWISSSIPAANPSRTTLNSVNAFLMKPT